MAKRPRTRWTNPWRLKGWLVEDYDPDRHEVTLFHEGTNVPAVVHLPELIHYLMAAEYQRGRRAGIFEKEAAIAKAWDVLGAG